jgi:ATP-dependent DNA helicase RecG
LNAIVHRNYATGNPIHVHIYPNEVLIYNDGKLPDTWTVSDLFEPHTSVPHNPKVAGAFFRCGQIEACGRGVQTITEACEQWGLPAPFYRIRSNEVMVGFNTEPQFADKFAVNETQKSVLQLIQENPRISQSAIAEQLGMTKRGVQKSIEALKSAGVIERIGPAKGGHWEVLAKESNRHGQKQ